MLANFIFVFNSELVLFFTLIGLFSYIAILLINNFILFINNEKNQKLKFFSIIIKDIKKNFETIKKINNTIFFFSRSLFIFLLNLNLINHIFYKCIEINNFKNYFFFFFHEVIFFDTLSQKRETLNFNSSTVKETFLI